MKKLLITSMLLSGLISAPVYAQVYNSTGSSSNSVSGDVTLYRATLEAFNSSRYKSSGTPFARNFGDNFNKNTFNDKGSCVYLQPNGELAETMASVRDNPYAKSQTGEVLAESRQVLVTRLFGLVTLSEIAASSFPEISKKQMNYRQAVTFLTAKINESFESYLANTNDVLARGNNGDSTTPIQIFFKDPGGIDAEKTFCTKNQYRFLPKSVFKGGGTPVSTPNYGGAGGMGVQTAGHISESINFSEGRANEAYVKQYGVPREDGLFNTFLFFDESGSRHYYQFLQPEIGNTIGNKTVKSPLFSWETSNLYGHYSFKYENRQLTLFKDNQVWFAENSINGQNLTLGMRSDRGSSTSQKRGE
jgi:hypothetical protein